MGTFSLSHWVVVLAIVLIVFGAGRIPTAMGDLARGMRAFRTGMREDRAGEAAADRLSEAARSDPLRS
jgi:sec-independent protein translocase protein TatA